MNLYMICPRILLVEDCQDARTTLSEILSKDYYVDSAGSAEQALERLQQVHFDLIILDLGLPGMDGYKFCTNLRMDEKLKETGVIILTGRIDIEDKLMGFSLGANDYLTKPFDIRELRARIQVQLSKSFYDEKKIQPLILGPFESNIVTQSISIQEGDKKIEISTSSLEFRILHLFLSRPDHVLSREQLLDQVWGNARYVNDRSVDVLISKLRKKLGSYGHLLQSVRGEGYRFKNPEEKSKAA